MLAVALDQTTKELTRYFEDSGVVEAGHESAHVVR